MAFTLVSFHAHPDDEALLTGGTLARAAAEGHRVVLVVATTGEAGLAASEPGAEPLGVRRARELKASARALGVARVVQLGFPDSGWKDSATGDPLAFGALPPEAAAAPLAEVLREEEAHVLTTYDPAGGYGHPDHRQVHRAGAVAARAASTPSVLEATIDRTLIRRVVRLAARVPRLLDNVDAAAFDAAFADPGDLTHRVDVREHLAAKRAAMHAHASQESADEGLRTLKLLAGLPEWAFARAVGREWFVARGRPPGRVDDVFSAVR